MKLSHVVFVLIIVSMAVIISFGYASGASEKTFIGDGTVLFGGAVFSDSSNTPYVVFIDTNNRIVVYKDLGTAPIKIASGYPHDVAYIDAAIDGSNNIHIISTAKYDGKKNKGETAYALFSSDGSIIIDWQVIPNSTKSSKPSIAIGPDNVPHAVFTQVIKQKGRKTSPRPRVVYTARYGSWSNIIPIDGFAATGASDSGYITVDKHGKVDIVLRDWWGYDLYHRTISGGLVTTSAIYKDNVQPLRTGNWIVTDANGSAYAYYPNHAPGSNPYVRYELKENGAYTGVIISSGWQSVSAVERNGKRYAFYIDTGNIDFFGVSVNVYDGSWTNYNEIEPSHYKAVFAQWSGNFDNHDDYINYVFSDSSKVYFNRYPQ